MPKDDWRGVANSPPSWLRGTKNSIDKSSKAKASSRALDPAPIFFRPGALNGESSVYCCEKTCTVSVVGPTTSVNSAPAKFAPFVLRRVWPSPRTPPALLAQRRVYRGCSRSGPRKPPRVSLRRRGEKGQAPRGAALEGTFVVTACLGPLALHRSRAVERSA